MNAPPPYYAPGPKKSNVGLIVGLVIGAIVLCCIGPIAFFGFFINGAVHNAFGYVGCGWSIQQMRDGLVAYSKAHGGKLPAKEHWQDDIASFLKPMKDAGPIKLPPANGDVCDLQAGTSVTFNSDLAGKKMDSIKDPESAIILWEVPGRGRNQSAPYSPPSYQTGPKIVANVPRGWIEQPLYGDAFFKDQTGRKQPIGQGPAPTDAGDTTPASSGASSKSSSSSTGD